MLLPYVASEVPGEENEAGQWGFLWAYTFSHSWLAHEILTVAVSPPNKPVE